MASLITTVNALTKICMFSISSITGILVLNFGTKKKQRRCWSKWNRHPQKWMNSGNSKNRKSKNNYKQERVTLSLENWSKSGTRSKGMPLNNQSINPKLFRLRKKDQYHLTLKLGNLILQIFLRNGKKYSMLLDSKKSTWKIRKLWSLFLKKPWFTKLKRLMKRIPIRFRMNVWLLWKNKDRVSIENQMWVHWNHQLWLVILKKPNNVYHHLLQI